ncbi:MAG: NADH-quinone oxidoreductase subunit NuoN [Rhodospirillales bacterium]|nr:NADH-quinone oxidoreductase subunit NuoN [Rhodospirillales bacterium]
MPSFPLPPLSPALPEIFLAAASMALLLFGVFRGERAAREASWLAALALVVAVVLVLGGGGPRQLALYGMFVTDAFAVFMKVLVLLGGIFAIVMSIRWNEQARIARFEFPVLVLLATTGMMMMVSAADLISLYIGLELQSLSLYVLAGFKRDTVRSAEAGLKYFVLGALASGMMLYGCSMVYGFAGATDFATLAATLSGGETLAIGPLVGIVFVVVGLAFKVSAVPFHMWTPDVYEGAPTPVTAFFSVAPKVAAIALFLRVMIEPFGGYVADWRQVIWLISVASMVLGSVAAINQSNFKRLMAYSSIGHIGYALIGLAAGSKEGVESVLIYMAIYVFMNVGTFAVILLMRRNGEDVEAIDDLQGLAQTHPALALSLAIFMFAMAGIPPLSGFFGKLYVFMAAINAELYVLAVIGVVTSVVGAYYYIRIVKLMYFDAPKPAFDRPFGAEMSAVLAVTAVVTLFFFIAPSVVVDSAAAAAASLFPG